MSGIEPETSSLPRKRSTPELHRRKKERRCNLYSGLPSFSRSSKMSGKRGSNSRPQPWKGCALPTELFPLVLRNFSEGVQDYFTWFPDCSPSLKLRRTQWGEKDSNLRSRMTADLQSAPVGHFGISPVYYFKELSIFLARY